MINIISRIWVLYSTLFRAFCMVTGLDRWFYLFCSLFCRLSGLHNIEFTTRRIVADEINNPRNHPWEHQPDQANEDWWGEFNPDERVFNENDFNEWGRPWDIYDFYDVMNQLDKLNYQFIIFSFLSILNIILMKWVNNDFWLFYQELKLKNNNVIISELYFNEIKFRIYLSHLFNIILDDDYCKIINQKITFLHSSNKDSFDFIISENIDFFRTVANKYKFGLIDNTINTEVDFLKIILDARSLEPNLLLKENNFFSLKINALKELIFLKNCFDDFENNFKVELDQLNHLRNNILLVSFNIIIYFIIAFLSLKNNT